MIHPQKLYTSIRACSTPSTRARAVLEFLTGFTSCESGFLYLARGTGVTLAAGGDPPPGLNDYVDEAWVRQREAEPFNSRTLDAGELEALRRNANPRWNAGNGDTYEGRLLSTYRGADWATVGVAMLRVPSSGTLLGLRHAHVQAICKALIEAEDIIDAS